MEKVKGLQNLAYQLGLEECKYTNKKRFTSFHTAIRTIEVRNIDSFFKNVFVAYSDQNPCDHYSLRESKQMSHNSCEADTRWISRSVTDAATRWCS